MISGMIQTRNVGINAKTCRYNVEEFRKKNPAKSFGEALAAVYNSAVVSYFLLYKIFIQRELNWRRVVFEKTEFLPSHPNRAALTEAIANTRS
ncbi:hypothetical protein OESDEN_06619 [Oesophagostomum dentatum]|uniref:Uncharacterized protein n=1 Tax=Oesophagostomum dentatum TaxID=61180 RepID=A0A0B1TCA2_OESDE|nr:hypothetical protein OESDEN_06619 [Oesophagostomum dentatum]